MMLCPDCHHQELLGAIFCSECGERLVDLAIQRTKRDSDGSSGFNKNDINHESSAVYPDSHREPFISLLIITSGHVIPLVGRNEFTLGRFDPDQPIQPNVDLNPYGAYQSGISRLHASIQIGQKVTLQDLGSSNGTKINGLEIPSNRPQLLSHGDILTLGKMNIQVFIHI